MLFSVQMMLEYHWQAAACHDKQLLSSLKAIKRPGVPHSVPSRASRQTDLIRVLVNKVKLLISPSTSK
jgi:hypothetical protein